MPNMECRDSLGVFNQSVFSFWTCSLCYAYLFPKDEWKFNYDRDKPGLSRDLVTSYQPHIEKPETFETICNTIDLYKCDRWKQCCEAATKCCKQQISSEVHPKNETERNICPRTWDGWSCFNDTLAGTTVEKSCPTFILYGNLEGNVKKECTLNGTWARHEGDGHEWTDYSKCVDIQDKKGIVYACVLSCSLSLLLLIPAITVFLVYRQLRSQQRIQLHVCLLCSFVLFCILKLIWILIVYDDRIENRLENTFMLKNEGGCKVVYVLMRYARCTNFFWMFCEGLFLHRLLVHAFNSPKHIKPYLIIAWGLPILPVFVYSLMRGFFANDVCWIKNAGELEWIDYTPNLLCIMINLLFLLKILNILLTQLHQHPNEPNNYRRALRATFVLIPLFGLQLFLVIYRPGDSSIQDVYEIVSTIVIDLQVCMIYDPCNWKTNHIESDQVTHKPGYTAAGERRLERRGGIIALVFCYFNGEVIHCIKTSVNRFRSSKRLPSFATYYSEVTQKVDGDKSKNHSRTLKTDLVQMQDVQHGNGGIRDEKLLDI